MVQRSRHSNIFVIMKWFTESRDDVTVHKQMKLTILSRWNYTNVQTVKKETWQHKWLTYIISLANKQKGNINSLSNSLVSYKIGSINRHTTYEIKILTRKMF